MPEEICKFFSHTVLVLLAFHLIAVYVRYGLGYYNAKGFVPTFYFDGELTILSIYSTLAIFACAVILWALS
jgi:hypothetical protein